MISRQTDGLLKLGLLVANLVALNFVVAPLRARVDLTAQREYTVSDVTKKVLAELPDRLEIHGYFSEETHPKLQPLIPKIRDMVEEYRIYGRGKVVASFVDPRNEEAAEKEAFKRFDVRPEPVPIQTKFESGMKSIYFTLVVAFGDRSAKLDLRDLIEVRPRGDDIEVRLRNFEYQLTRAIEKVVREFGSLETRLAELKEPVKLFIYASDKERVPEGEIRDHVEKRKKQLVDVAEELRKKYKVGFEAEVIDPAAKEGTADEIKQLYGVVPLRASLQSSAGFYLDAVVRHGNKAERLNVRDLPERERSPGEIRDAIEASIRRHLPGALHRVGIASNKPDIPPEALLEYYKRGQQPPGDEYQHLRQALRAGYEVVDVSLADGRPPLDVDVLLVMKPKDYTEKQLLAIDQYLMYGGKAIICVDQTQIPAQARELSLEPITPKVDELLSRYGVTVRKELVEDDRNVPYPFQVTRDLGGLQIREIQQVPYPWFLDARDEQIDRDNPVIGGVDEVVLLWASPISIDAEKTKGLRVSTLITSSKSSWTTTDLRHVAPQASRYGAKTYVVPDKTAPEPVAVALEGRLSSGMKDRPQGVTPPAGFEPLAESTVPTRLVVIGDADFASDIAPQVTPAGFKSNVQLVENLIDWALLDEAMIRIRSRGTGDRPIRADVDKDKKAAIELANYAIPIGLVIAFGVLRALLRGRGPRRLRPQDAKAAGAAKGVAGARA
jgi:ABC-2 type transport system permease protein